jgi:hypothetical protein
MDGINSGIAIDQPDYVADQIAQIQKWKTAEPGVVSATISAALQPVSWAFNKVVPPKAIEAILSGADWLSEQSIPTNQPDKRASLQDLDQDAKEVQNWAIAYAVGEGAIAGWLGFLSAPVDIPAIILLSLRTIRRVGLCYGYSGDSRQEREFVLGVLGCAGANTMEEKVAAMFALTSIHNMVSKVAFKKMAQKAAEGAIGKEFAIIALRDLAKQVGVNLTKRKLLAGIPIVGAVVGGSVNGWYLDDIGTAAHRAYQERWLRDRGLWLDQRASKKSNRRI